MGKFRSKLKRNAKGKTWAKGTSATTNPVEMKHRLKAKSRFFQPNISLAPPPPEPGKTTLTLEAVLKHEQRQLYANTNKEPTVQGK